MSTPLSPHFSLEELTVTSQQFPNTPGKAQLVNLTKAAAGMEKVRALLGQPIKVNSGFRSPAVNKAVGGSPTSAHVQGDAVDFVCPGFGTPYEICLKISKSGIKYDQLIQEGTWVHVSFAITMRQQNLTKRPGNKYAPGIQP